MSDFFYQAVYAHPKEGWAVINTSDDLPEKLSNDFSSIERVNAGLASGTPVPMGDNETPSCMIEIYFKNDAVGLVRVQYGLSDVQGRPVSFAHGYIFPDAYTMLKQPERIVSIKNENFADQKISEEEKAKIRSMPGALNEALIEKSIAKDMPLELTRENSLSVKDALEICKMTKESYSRYILAIYVHILSSKTENNLYIKTDGTEVYARNLLFLTYSAIPFSMRSQLSASTYLHMEQHNTKLIYCAELPDNMPHIDPVSGNNNVMNDTLEKRTKDRNPFIMRAVDCVMDDRQIQFFTGIEVCLRLMGNERLDSMQAINLAFKFGMKEYDNAEQLPGMIYSWGALQVPNSEEWEKSMAFLLKKAEELSVSVGSETRDMLSSRIEKAVTNSFRNVANAYLASFGERK